MKKIFDLLRFIIISPELAVGLGSFFFLLYFSNIAEFTSSYLFNNKMEWDDYAKLLGLPITVLVIMYKMSEIVLNPEDKDNRSKLKQWPDYWMLKNRIYYSLLIAVVALVGSLGCWYYALTIDVVLGTILLLTFWSISLTSLATVALAKLSIKDILY